MKPKDNDLNEKTRTPDAETKRVLVLRRGSAYHLMWFILIFPLVAAAVVAAVGGFGWHLLVLLVISLLCIPGLQYYRKDRTLEIDSRGVRLLRGTKVSKDFPWNDVKRVRHGTKLLASWVFSLNRGYILSVVGPRFWQRISLDDVSLHDPDYSLVSTAAAIVEMAKSHSIPVDEVSIEEVRQSPRVERIFGPHVALVPLVLAIGFGLALMLYVWLSIQTGITPLDLIAFGLFGLPFVLFTYGAITGRRFFCPNCEGFRYFYRRRGQYYCSKCRKSLQPPSRGG